MENIEDLDIRTPEPGPEPPEPPVPGTFIYIYSNDGAELLETISLSDRGPQAGAVYFKHPFTQESTSYGRGIYLNCGIPVLWYGLDDYAGVALSLNQTESIHDTVLYTSYNFIWSPTTNTTLYVVPKQSGKQQRILTLQNAVDNISLFNIEGE